MEGRENVSTLLSILYKHYSLTLKKEELTNFLDYLRQFNLVSNLRKDEKDRLVLTFWKEEEKHAVSLCLEEYQGNYIIHQRIKVDDPYLENVIRESISAFQITTIAEHHFADNVMIYYYQKGVISKITEKTTHSEKIIYQFPHENIARKSKDTLENTHSKAETFRKEMNRLLDRRNNCSHDHEIALVDEQLKGLTQKMKSQFS